MENIVLWAVSNAINQFIQLQLKYMIIIITRSINFEEASQGSQKKPASKNPVGKTQDRKSGTGQAQLTSPARTSRLQ